MTKKLSNNQSLLRGFIEREFNRSDYTRVSDYFEFFAADKTLKEDELSADDINLGLMGRSGDGGCDGAYLFCNSELVHEDEIKSVADRSREAQLRVVIIQAKNELSFNELYFLVASICQKTDITFADFMNIDFSAIEDEQIQSALDQVYNLYRDMGGNSKVAKGSKLILSIRETINS